MSCVRWQGSAEGREKKRATMVSLPVFTPLQKAGNLNLREMLGQSNGLGAILASVSEHQKHSAFWSHYNVAWARCPKAKGWYNTSHS